MDMFGIYNSDPLKSAARIQFQVARHTSDTAESDRAAALRSLGVDTADIKGIPSSAGSSSTRSVADVKASAKEALSFVDTPEGKILEQLLG